jgi:hypothetical protein
MILITAWYCFISTPFQHNVVFVRDLLRVFSNGVNVMDNIIFDYPRRCLTWQIKTSFHQFSAKVWGLKVWGQKSLGSGLELSDHTIL